MTRKTTIVPTTAMLLKVAAQYPHRSLADQYRLAIAQTLIDEFESKRPSTETKALEPKPY